MTPKQAAIRIGCTFGHVKHLCRTGRLSADKIEMTPGGKGSVYTFHWNISEEAIKEFLCAPRVEHRGRPRGNKPRKVK